MLLNSNHYKNRTGEAVVAIVVRPRWKRILDVSLIVMAFPGLLPLMVLIGLLIRIVSAGPVLFKQERIGYLGKRFLCYKFRTMHVNSDTGIHQGHLERLMNSDAPMIKMDTKGDPRIIRFGRLLRSSGLDELPQLINVLRGEMSLVGPRPCVSYEYEKYLPWQRERFNTVPGLTGLWQVSGKNKTTFTEMIQLDIRYARTKTLMLDLKIIFMTIPTLLVQVWETWLKNKTAGRVISSKVIMSNQSEDECCLQKATLIQVVNAATDTEHRRKLGIQ
jgi:lipopolysaccharide/colanic/teichoic acid biosynthesis glycosyltransferase